MELEVKDYYLSVNLNRNFLGALGFDFLASAAFWSVFPSFSVTTHSLARPASSRPMNVALVRCKDITFSKRIQ